ncbi:MAG: hypothetical protein U1A25_00710 [Candidatus Sungbacteria bacterium]|nr:hypothetical protein [bacterium]MDZ4260164.1 hypothetical protein [Candidatus Sungbacteria bacterium]
MEYTRINAALLLVLDSIAQEDESCCFIAVFVHLTRDFGEDELRVIKDLRERSMVTRAHVYSKRLLGLDATKKAIEELATKNWVLVINLSGRKKLAD